MLADQLLLPRSLQHLGDGQRHETTRPRRQPRRNSLAEAADTEAYANDATPADSEFYRGEIELMRLAFTGPTHLKYSISNKEEPEVCITIAAKLAFQFLSTAKGLQKLRLAIGRLVDGILLPMYESDERQCMTGSMLLLRNLALHAPWSQIRNIELEIATDRTTPVTFLFAHKNTLLILTRTSLGAVERPSDYMGVHSYRERTRSPLRVRYIHKAHRHPGELGTWRSATHAV